jgi:hypothetical protein
MRRSPFDWITLALLVARGDAEVFDALLDVERLTPAPERVRFHRTRGDDTFAPMALAALHALLMLLVPLLGGALVAALLRRSATAQARRHRARVLEAMSGDGTSIRGRLVVHGEGCAGAEEGRGQRLAAVGRWRSSKKRGLQDLHPIDSERAASVTLVTDDGEVELAGPIRVAMGGALRLEDAKLGGAGHRVVMTLASGDEATAIGRLVERDEAHEGDYRGKVIQRRLEPAEENDEIVLVGGAERVHIEMLARQPAVLAVAIPLMWLPANALKDWIQTANRVTAKECHAVGRCHAVPTWRWQDWSDVLRGWWRGDHYEIGPASAADCKASVACGVAGACAVGEDRCRAKRDEDCRASWQCMTSGNCSAVDDHCTVAKPQDCAYLSTCWYWGRCSVDANHHCAVLTDADCAATKRCTENAECSAANEYSCTATKDADCAGSALCRDDGRCVFASQQCRLADAWCRASEECNAYGWCSGSDYSCEPKRDEDCRASEQCAAVGACTASNGLCTGDDHADGCAKSEQCRAVGRCGGGDTCKPRDDRDCEQSLACKETGACKLIDDKCRKSCAEHPDCKSEGTCTLRGGACVRASDADCRQTFGCARRGLCSFDGGFCVAKTDEDCRGSKECAQLGRCTAKERACVLAGAADCTQTDKCKRDGVCAFVNGHCDVGDETCKRSVECHLLGECSIRIDDKAHTYECYVNGDDDCKASEVCTRFGWCVATLPKSTDANDRYCFTGAQIDLEVDIY